MKKLLWIFAFSLTMARGNGSDGNNEAAADEDVDIGAGEEISPQLELDSSDTRFEVDTLSSTREAEKESDNESF